MINYLIILNHAVLKQLNILDISVFRRQNCTSVLVLLCYGKILLYLWSHMEIGQWVTSVDSTPPLILSIGFSQSRKKKRQMTRPQYNAKPKQKGGTSFKRSYSYEWVV